MKLRPYQAEAVEAATEWMRRSIMPGLLELATGAGKSIIVAEIARWIYDHSGKKVLCLQPSKELTEQNASKYLATGNPASIFSASAGGKCMRHNVVYGTPQTVKNSLSRFGDMFGAVILDEAHGITPTIVAIIDAIRARNKNLRVIGLTATPYRTTTGFIYRYDTDGSFVPEDQARDPYFNTLLYRIQTRQLIDMGFLTEAHADPEIAAQYAAGNLQVGNNGKFKAADIERVFEGRGRLTAQIVADIVQHALGRQGVMIFAATVDHAKEIMESLPVGISRMLGGDINMKRIEREALIADFKARKFKYLVSVGTLTTGFDAPHVDLIAIMRATESPGLLQQIIGRGLRLSDGKADCLVLDYAENIERHNLHDDLFTPEIRVKGSKSGGELLFVECPDCGFENEFGARPNKDGFQISQSGYFLDLAGNEIATPHGPMPAHFGRRCTGQVASMFHKGVFERCEYRWTYKECPECDHKNDIAARFCEECKHELVDPNEKLRQEFQRVKRDPYSISTDEILSWSAMPSTSQSGKETIVCEYTTPYRTFKIWYVPQSNHPQAKHAWRSLNEAVFAGHVAPDAATFIRYLDRGHKPKTITCHRERGSKFYKVIAHNRPADESPS